MARAEYIPPTWNIDWFKISSPKARGAIEIDASDFKRLAKKYEHAARSLRSSIGHAVSWTATWAAAQLNEDAPKSDRPLNDLRYWPPFWDSRLKGSFRSNVVGAYDRVVVCDESLKLSFVVFGVNAPRSKGAIWPRYPPRKYLMWPGLKKPRKFAPRPRRTATNDFVTPVIGEVQEVLEQRVQNVVYETIGLISDEVFLTTGIGSFANEALAQSGEGLGGWW